MFAVETKKVIKYDKVVVGSSVEAVEYARRNKIPILLSNDECPFRFDEHDGSPKIEIWSKGLWEIGMQGNNPLSLPADLIRITEEKIQITYAGSKSVEVEYNKCFLFDSHRNVRHHLDQCGEESGLYRVFDWLSIDRCEGHDKERISTGDDFVNEIIFYPSDRIDGRHSFKDVVAVSYLTEDQLGEFDFSDTMCVFKVRHHMLESGIRGRVSYYNKKGNAHRYKVRLRPSSREVEKISKTFYRSTDKVHFCENISLKEIFDGKGT